MESMIIFSNNVLNSKKMLILIRNKLIEEKTWKFRLPILILLKL